MTLQEAVTLLENHNKWRRGDDTLEMAEPKDLGMAIELIVEHFNTKEKGVKVSPEITHPQADFDDSGDEIGTHAALRQHLNEVLKKVVG